MAPFCVLCRAGVCRREAAAAAAAAAVVPVNETQSAELTLQFLPSAIAYGAALYLFCQRGALRAKPRLHSAEAGFYSFPSTAKSLPLGGEPTRVSYTTRALSTLLILYQLFAPLPPTALTANQYGR